MNNPLLSSDSLLIFVLGEQALLDSVRQAFAGSNDRVVGFTDLAEAALFLDQNGSDVRVVFIDVSLGDRGALAVVHHASLQAPNADVYALVRSSASDTGPQAIALGAKGLLSYPPTGDELHSAAAAARTRLGEQLRLFEVQQEVFFAQRGFEAISKLSALRGSDSDRTSRTTRTLILLRDLFAAVEVAIYARDHEHEPLRRVAHMGSAAAQTTAIDHVFSELLPDSVREREGIVEINLPTIDTGHGVEAIVLLRTSIAVPETFRRPLCLALGDLVASLALTSSARFAPPSVRASLLPPSSQTQATQQTTETEIAREVAIKDPTSSAYSFGYFVDFASREIDRARRHHRRFVLAMVSRNSQRANPVSSIDLAESLLVSVRDIDVVARMDDDEFAVLLPETDGVDAFRTLRSLWKRSREDLSSSEHVAVIGGAVFPHDGTSLWQLVQIARRRGEASRSSAVNRLRLSPLSLSETLDALLWDPPVATGGAADAEAPRAIELVLPDAQRLVLGMVQQGCRAGKTRVVFARREGHGLDGGLGGASRDDLLIETPPLRGSPDVDELDAAVVVAEHGVYSILGRVDRHRFHGVHSADPLLADLVLERLGV